MRWFRHFVRGNEEVEIKKVFELKIGQRKRQASETVDSRGRGRHEKEGSSAIGCWG